MAASVPVPSVSLAWLQSGRGLWALSWSPTVVHSLEFQLLPRDPRPRGHVQTWPRCPPSVGAALVRQHLWPSRVVVSRFEAALSSVG